MDNIFKDLVKIGITFPKKNVKLPKNWQNFTQSKYNNENNYAVLTGKVNDIIVIDLDNKDKDFTAYKWFRNNLNNVNEINTLVTTTINNGYHIYFRYTDEVANTNNSILFIDILSNKRCCYQGEGYPVINNADIRELTKEEIIKLKTLNAKKKDTTSKTIVPYKKANTLLKLPENTEWDIKQTAKGKQLIPKCLQCLLDPSKEHSHVDHSSIFINDNTSVIKTCFSDGSEILNRKEAKKLVGCFKIILETQENTIYQDLVEDLLDIGEEHSFRRGKKTGIVYKKVKEYAYIKYEDPEDFLNKYFIDNNKFISNVKNMDNLVKFMKQYDNYRFPFLITNKDYIGFSNGVLNKITLQFDTDPENIIVDKYIDQEFTYSMSTPLVDKILDYQFTSDVRDFIYANLGRMFGIRDNFGVMLYLLGEAGTGKSVILNILCECFNNVGSINSSYEGKYGLSYLYNKDIIICDDLPKDIQKIFPQQDFQTIVTGGKISTAVKNGDAIIIEKWSVPIIWSGNWLPSYLDKGQISRRLLVTNFEKNVLEPDISLESRIKEEELSAFIYKCLIKYNQLLENARNKSIWKVCPEYFREQQEDLKMEKNPLYKFLKDNTRYCKNNTIPIEEIKTQFSQWLGAPVYKLDNGTFSQVNEKYNIDTMMICKACQKEAIKGCCEQYINKERTSKKIVRNIEFI